ncbi:MAG: nucleotidyl transferase AbiEii/AbiGii toxin family protein [Candidatus Roizmanbacteria bacterium]|nr:nucleotidyl transferase AbiEii/AbiGii toxin family protein [Candidatus Roizmanbacteria bacterium]
MDNTRQELLQKLIPQVQDFVLGGGTGLSLQIAHRLSYDFDFFSEQPIPKNFLEKISQVIQVKEVSVDSSDELTFFDTNNVKCTFLYYYFTPHFETIEVSNGMKIFSVPEIAIKKAYTIGRRGAYRDYFDLYTILKNEYSTLKEIIVIAEEVYKTLFSSKLFLEQLVYFKDLPDFDIEPVGNASIPTPETVKQYFEHIVAMYLEESSK